MWGWGGCCQKSGGGGLGFTQKNLQKNNLKQSVLCTSLSPTWRIATFCQMIVFFIPIELFLLSVISWDREDKKGKSHKNSCNKLICTLWKAAVIWPEGYFPFFASPIAHFDGVISHRDISSTSVVCWSFTSETPGEIVLRPVWICPGVFSHI